MSDRVRFAYQSTRVSHYLRSTQKARRQKNADVGAGKTPLRKELLSAQYDFSAIGPQIEGVAGLVLDAIRKVKPSKATVELGCDFEVGISGLVDTFVKDNAKATLQITLEWSSEQAKPEGGVAFFSKNDNGARFVSF